MRGPRGYLQLPEVCLQKSPNCIMLALLQGECGMQGFLSALYPRSSECFLIGAGDPPTPDLLMRKAPRTQKLSRYYSLTFERLAGEAAARRGRASASSGLRSGTRSNTGEPRYVRNIKTNQPPSATPHLRPQTAGCRASVWR